MLWAKNSSCKEFDNEKNFLQLEKFPSPPPHNFSNGPSLSDPILPKTKVLFSFW